MKMDLFLQRVSNIQLKNQTYRFLVLVMALVLLANSFYTYRMLVEQRIIVIPPGGLDEKVEVSMNAADGEYLKIMSRYVTGLYLTYSPASARRQFSEILALFHPSKFEAGRVSMSDLADKVERSKVTSVFNIGSIEYDMKPGRLFTIRTVGKRTLYVKGRGIEDKDMTFVLTGWIKQGRLYVDEMKEIINK